MWPYCVNELSAWKLKKTCIHFLGWGLCNKFEQTKPNLNKIKKKKYAKRYTPTTTTTINSVSNTNFCFQYVYCVHCVPHSVKNSVRHTLYIRLQFYKCYEIQWNLGSADFDTTFRFI